MQKHDKTKLLLLVAAVLISIFPILTTAPLWLIFASLLCLALRVLQSMLNSPPTHWLFKLLLTVSGFLMLIIEVKGRIDYMFFIYFLILFVSLKVLEIDKKRDYLSQILVNFYALFASLIIIMELWIFAFIILATLFNVVVLFKIYHPSIQLRFFGRQHVTFLILSIATTILLFYTFPRISSPLWQLPSPGQKQTGFSDQLSLGDVRELVLDDSQAMKVISSVYLGKHPYWRGLALSFYDGRTWQISKAAYTRNRVVKRLGSQQQAQIEIILEPTQTPWLITNGQVTQGYPPMLHIPNVGTMQLSKQRVTRQLGYRFNRSTRPSKKMNASIFHLNQQYPGYANPRLQHWVRHAGNGYRQQPEKLIEKLKKEIIQKPFWYTLTPAPIGKNAQQLDRFWFETREGYCEYYASTVAFILRVAKVPARVIVGYQGGQWNPIGQYIDVRQSDAHAWVEYWHPQKGWLQIDPTSWIPASRIDQSIQSRVGRYRQSAFDMDSDRYGYQLSFWQRSKYFIESAHFFWQRWLLFYNYDTQKQLMDMISGQQLSQWFFNNLPWIGLLIITLSMLIGLRWWQKQPDRLQRKIQTLKQIYGQENIDYHPPQTFTTICDQLRQRFPEHISYINAMQQEYETFRYRTQPQQPKPLLIRFLIKLIRKIKQWRKAYQPK